MAKALLAVITILLLFSCSSLYLFLPQLSGGEDMFVPVVTPEEAAESSFHPDLSIEADYRPTSGDGETFFPTSHLSLQLGLGGQISREFKNDSVLQFGLMPGGFIGLADISFDMLRDDGFNLDSYLQSDYLRLLSWGYGGQASLAYTFSHSRTRKYLFTMGILMAGLYEQGGSYSDARTVLTGDLNSQGLEYDSVRNDGTSGFSPSFQFYLDFLRHTSPDKVQFFIRPFIIQQQAETLWPFETGSGGYITANPGVYVGVRKMNLNIYLRLVVGPIQYTQWQIGMTF